MKNEDEKFQVFADETERIWKKSIPRYKEKELVEIFSPTLEMIKDKMKEEKSRFRILSRFIKRTLKQIYTLNADEFSTWFGERMIEKFFFPDLEKSDRNIARLERIINILRPPTNQIDTYLINRERATQYPIYEIARSHLELKNVGNKFLALCPFHNEKHPSFYLYPETNTYYCFGCHESGNVISLTMHLYGMTFREVLQILQ